MCSARALSWRAGRFDLADEVNEWHQLDHLHLNVSSVTAINLPLRCAVVLKGATDVLISDMAIPGGYKKIAFF